MESQKPKQKQAKPPRKRKAQLNAALRKNLARRKQQGASGAKAEDKR